MDRWEKFHLLPLIPLNLGPKQRRSWCLGACRLWAICCVACGSVCLGEIQTIPVWPLKWSEPWAENQPIRATSEQESRREIFLTKPQFSFMRKWGFANMHSRMKMSNYKIRSEVSWIYTSVLFLYGWILMVVRFKHKWVPKILLFTLTFSCIWKVWISLFCISWFQFSFNCTYMTSSRFNPIWALEFAGT